MNRKLRFYLILMLLIPTAIFGQDKLAVPYGNNPKAGSYFDNHGVKIYYEVYGAGKPLVLLHGSGGSIAGRGDYIEEFAKKYKVIAIDSRCHGKTDCPKGYLTYEQMAGDVSALLTHLKIDSTYIWGHSDGAILGLLLAIHYPARVKKLLASGANLRPDTTAIDPALLPLLDKMKSLVKTDSVRNKQFRLLVDQPHISHQDLHRIKADILIMAGDRDAIRNKHTLEIFDNIPGALLCILPGTTHGVYSQRRKWFTDILSDFFDNPPARTTTAQMMMSQFK